MPSKVMTMLCKCKAYRPCALSAYARLSPALQLTFMLCNSVPIKSFSTLLAILALLDFVSGARMDLRVLERDSSCWSSPVSMRESSSSDSVSCVYSLVEALFFWCLAAENARLVDADDKSSLNVRLLSTLVLVVHSSLSSPPLKYRIESTSVPVHLLPLRMPHDLRHGFVLLERNPANIGIAYFTLFCVLNEYNLRLIVMVVKHTHHGTKHNMKHSAFQS
jgi:hypothetical protein